MATEFLFVAAGAPIWEFVERAGSYAAPLALAVLLRDQASGVVDTAPDGSLPTPTRRTTLGT
jgi:hypothetical protein